MDNPGEGSLELDVTFVETTPSGAYYQKPERNIRTNVLRQPVAALINPERSHRFKCWHWVGSRWRPKLVTSGPTR
jgi:hypothetical protein